MIKVYLITFFKLNGFTSFYTLILINNINCSIIIICYNCLNLTINYNKLNNFIKLVNYLFASFL